MSHYPNRGRFRELHQKQFDYSTRAVSVPSATPSELRNKDDDGVERIVRKRKVSGGGDGRD